jgi:ppGpp synthetase/RelA/SpoT-type nucleotidyltranferase
VTTIEQAIQDLFPEELIGIEPFDDWCCELRTEVFPGAADLKWLLENRLEEVLRICEERDGTKRDFRDLFGGTDDRLIKSVKSVRSKLGRDLLADKVTSRLEAHELRRRVFEFGDLGRIRIVTDFLSDVAYLQEILFEGGKFLDRYPCPKGIKDFIFDPNHRDGLKGHRARQFSVRAPCGNKGTFGLEVQLMTRLQHAWDRRNHPLYEWQREKDDWKDNPAAVRLAVNDFACAETLHLVDQQADRNWCEFLAEKNGEKSS